MTTGVTPEKIREMMTWTGDNSPSVAMFCDDCDHFVNDWSTHKRSTPEHKTRMVLRSIQPPRPHLPSFCRKHWMMTEVERIDFMESGAFVNLACGCNHWLRMDSDSELLRGKR